MSPSSLGQQKTIKREVGADVQKQAFIWTRGVYSQQEDFISSCCMHGQPEGCCTVLRIFK